MARWQNKYCPAEQVRLRQDLTLCVNSRALEGSPVPPYVSIREGKSVFEWLPAALNQAQQRASASQTYWNASFTEPASEDELTACELAVSRSLSPQHRAFLKMSNGAIISIAFPGRPWATFGVRIYSTREIVEDSGNIANESDSSATVLMQLVAFCNYDDGDRCLADYSRVRNGEPVIIDAFHETPGAWANSAPIADSFESWLKRMLDTFIVQGRPLWYWLPDASEDTASTVKGITDRSRTDPDSA